MAANLPTSSRVKQEPVDEPDNYFTFNTPSGIPQSNSYINARNPHRRDPEETEFQIPPRFSSNLRAGNPNQPNSPPVRSQNDSGTIPVVSSRIHIPSTSRARITAPDEDHTPPKKGANKRQNPAAVIMEAEPIRKQKKNAQKNKKNRGLISVEPLDLLELPPESEEIIYSYEDDPSYCETGPTPVQLSAEDLRSLLHESEQRLEKKLMAHIVNNIKQNRMQQTVEMLKEINDVKIFVQHRLDRNDQIQEQILEKIDKTMDKMQNFAEPDVDFVHVGPDLRDHIGRRPSLRNDDYDRLEAPRTCSETSQPFSPSAVSSDSIEESVWSEGIDENEEQDSPAFHREPDLRQEYREEKTAPWRRSTPKDRRHQSYASKSSEHPDGCRLQSSTSCQQRHNHADSTETRRKEQDSMTNDHPHAHAIESDVPNSGSRRTEISASSSDDQQYAKQAQEEMADEIEDGEILDGCQEVTMETPRNSKITPISWP